jgi:alpha-mannosidase
LIKSPIRPDPLADQGLHQFTYSLLPHAGNWRVGRVAQHAYDLNYPLHVDYLAAHERASLPSSYSFAQVDTDHVMIETVKRAEDGDGWIVRMYEYQQSRNNTITITFCRPLARAVECNLLEEEMALVTFDRQHIMCAVKPYEIKTFKVWFDL